MPRPGAEAEGGAVTLIQRFGSGANLSIRLHCLVLDGVYQRSEAGPAIVEVPTPHERLLCGGEIWPVNVSSGSH